MASFSNPLPWFAICALCLLAAAGVVRTNGFYREQLAAAGGRFETIDGLRGFLALGVFGAHAVSMYNLRATGAWDASFAPFYERASIAGVGLFFMITAFLFWLRVLRAGEAFDVRAFFASRVRRLTPMYLASVLMALAVVAAASGFALRVEPTVLLHELRPWLSFGFLSTGELNGVREAHAINAVYWTLGYEWAFYLALPLLALFARGRWAVLPVMAVLYFGALASAVFYFLFGALAAAIVHRGYFQEKGFFKSWFAPVPLAALAAYFFADGLHQLLQAALLSVFFIFVVHGYSLLGLLRSRPAKVLGMASYSIYLTHCIVLYVAVHALDRLVPVAGLSAPQYWLLAALAALATVFLSTFTYRYVEFPFIHPQAASNTHGRNSWIRRPISGW